ncbi:iron-sulfur cluster-binding domain-containing protein [Rheinheimera sp.]|uniref:iron-sulfur cluster-binding domain-containing protein n=1 Tax=Rheinheimera sp. TaxID=1869214 RepID=UPI00307EDC1B
MWDLVFALSLLALFWLGRGLWWHWYEPYAEARRLNLQLYRVKRQGAYLKLWLRHPEGALLPKARAGQHLLLYGTDLAGKAVSRAYSIASDCSQRRYYQLVVKAEPDGRLSQALFQKAEALDTVLCSYPRGHFSLKPGRAPVVLVAAGVGITPLLAMALQAIRQRRQVTLVYQARNQADLLFYPMLRRLPAFTLVPCLSQPEAGWAGRAGRIDAGLLFKLGGAFAQYYFCCKALMTEKLICDLSILGAHQCFNEPFSAAASIQSFSIEMDGHQADSMGQRSVLDALIAASVPLSYDCKGGSCGLCKVRVVSGEYKQVLDAAVHCGDDEVLACCIQPTSALVLTSLDAEAEVVREPVPPLTKAEPA